MQNSPPYLEFPFANACFNFRAVSRILYSEDSMGETLDTKMGEVSLENERTPFGKEMLKHFPFDPAYKNLNQGILTIL